MQLRDYLSLAGTTYSELARRMGFSQAATVQRHAEGTRRPDALAVERYRRVTSGAVTAQDWHELALQVAENSTENPSNATNGRKKSTNGGDRREGDSSEKEAVA